MRERAAGAFLRLAESVSEICLVQGDGSLPTAVAFGSAPGENGVLVFRRRFQGGIHLSATPRRHHVYFHVTSQSRVDCCIAGQALIHSPPVGSLGICPAGADYSADVGESVDAILVAIYLAQFALAAAEDSALEAKLIERSCGSDQALWATPAAPYAQHHLLVHLTAPAAAAMRCLFPGL